MFMAQGVGLGVQLTPCPHSGLGFSPVPSITLRVSGLSNGLLCGS